MAPGTRFELNAYRYKSFSYDGFIKYSGIELMNYFLEAGDSNLHQRSHDYSKGILILCIIPIFMLSTFATSVWLASGSIQEPFAQWEIRDLSNFTDYDFTEIDFVNTTHGWLLGWDILLNTIDGGETWCTQLEGSSLHGLSIVNPNEIWVGGSGKLFHSNNSGTSWATIHGPTDLPTNVEFFNSTHGIVGDINELFLTEDGGNTWQNITRDSGQDFPKDFHLTSSSVWIASRLGIIRSDDWGNNWRVEYDGYAGAIDFITEEDAWAINWDNSFAHYNGEYWADLKDIHRLGASSLSFSFDIDFIDSNHGWVVGMTPSVAYTPDGGKTWYEQEWYDEDYIMPLFRSVHFLNETHGWVAGRNGIVARTTNGNLLGERLYSGLFLENLIGGGGTLIPYSSLFVGALTTGVYSVIVVWTRYSRKRKG
jgi:photosystem II stability/assembly factor-like uncharacterized protein